MFQTILLSVTVRWQEFYVMSVQVMFKYLALARMALSCLRFLKFPIAVSMTFFSDVVLQSNTIQCNRDPRRVVEWLKSF